MNPYDPEPSLHGVLFSGLAKDARAATNSYLIGVIEKAETDEAGRRFGKQRDRELREE